jgi:N-methylhydantoinase B/oxoprolinase/acetone carboxylase alpha subunit
VTWGEDIGNDQDLIPYITSVRWGGFYSPLEQDPDRVLEDVKQGYISLKCAEEKYGVVIDEKRMAVDEERTEEERLKMNSAV